MLINGLHIRIIHTTTGQISRELTLNPSPAVVSGPDVTGAWRSWRSTY
jgi:hypothetical protein